MGGGAGGRGVKEGGGESATTQWMFSEYLYTLVNEVVGRGNL